MKLFPLVFSILTVYADFNAPLEIPAASQDATFETVVESKASDIPPIQSVATVQANTNFQSPEECGYSCCTPQMPGCGFYLSLTPFFGQGGVDNFVIVKKAELSSTLLNARSEYMNFHWAPGFQIGAGCDFGPQTYWALNANWMWFYNTGSKTGEVPASTLTTLTYVSNYALPLLGSRIQSFRAKYNLHYNVFDLDTSRLFAPWDCLTLEAHLGARGASILQQFGNTNFSSFESSNGINRLTFFDSRYATSQKFYGVGLRTGTDLNFYFNDEWGLYGNFFASLLAGKSILHQKVQGALFSTDPVDGDSLSFLQFDNRDSFWSIKPNLEAELGFRYGTFFGCDKLLFSFEAGYLMSYWFVLSQIYQNAIIPIVQANVFTFSLQDNQNLFLQGAKFQFRMDY